MQRGVYIICMWMFAFSITHDLAINIDRTDVLGVLGAASIEWRSRGRSTYLKLHSKYFLVFDNLKNYNSKLRIFLILMHIMLIYCIYSIVMICVTLSGHVTRTDHVTRTQGSLSSI